MNSSQLYGLNDCLASERPTIDIREAQNRHKSINLAQTRIGFELGPINVRGNSIKSPACGYALWHPRRKWCFKCICIGRRTLNLVRRRQRTTSNNVGLLLGRCRRRWTSVPALTKVLCLLGTYYYLRGIMPCKPKRQYLLTLQVSSYILLFCFRCAEF